MEEKKVLIVDDEEILQRMYADYLRNHGYTVMSAYDGEEGLKMALSDHPDVILLDIRMPIMDGMSMLSKLRKDEWGKNANVILLTNLDANETILQGVVTDRPTYYLIKSNVKPKTVDDYIQMVFKNIEEATSGQSA